jgi:cell division protease FtsH
MKPQRLLRGPLIWVLLAVIGMWVLSSTLFARGPQRIDTSVGLELLASGKVDQAKIVDREQRVDLTLTEKYKDKGDLVRFYYVEPQGGDIVDAVEKAKPRGGYNSEVPTQSWLSSLAMTIIPFVIIIGVFWYMMSQMQGGGRGAMGFGKSRPNSSPPRRPR